MDNFTDSELILKAEFGYFNQSKRYIFNVTYLENVAQIPQAENIVEFHSCWQKTGSHFFVKRQSKSDNRRVEFGDGADEFRYSSADVLFQDRRVDVREGIPIRETGNDKMAEQLGSSGLGKIGILTL